MKVLVINDFGHVNGGAAAVAIASAAALARRGHTVTFISAVAPVDEDLSAAGARVVCTGQHEILSDPNRLRAACQGLWNPKAGRALALELAGASREDTIVHLHGWCKALSTSVVRAAVNRGYKVVCTLHDYFIACPTGGFFDHQSLEHCRLKPLSMSCVARNCDSRSYPHKLWRVARQMVQETGGKLPRGIDFFIVLSRLSRDVLRPYLPAGASLFEVPNPIDISCQPPVNVERNQAFTMVGRLSPEKGGTLFARAARDSGVSTVFVGDGPSRKEITQACPEATITGWVPKGHVANYLEEARALVLPSLWYETQALVVLEAAARGVPAIVSEGCAAAEFVDDGVTGLLFRSGDILSLSGALRELQDDSLARRLGRAAYERYWADPPTLEKHVKLLEEAYGRALA